MTVAATLFGPSIADLSSTAKFSDCGRYRYRLVRRVAMTGYRVMVICGYNPSVADAEKNDATIRRDMSFARREGCAWLVKINMFAAISTDPKVLAFLDDPVGPENDEWIEWQIARTVEADGILVAAWGSPKPATQGMRALVDARATDILGMSPLWKCFGLTKSGYPRHPLYLPNDTPLISLETSDA